MSFVSSQSVHWHLEEVNLEKQPKIILNQMNLKWKLNSFHEECMKDLLFFILSLWSFYIKSHLWQILGAVQWPILIFTVFSLPLGPHALNNVFMIVTDINMWDLKETNIQSINISLFMLEVWWTFVFPTSLKAWIAVKNYLKSKYIHAGLCIHALSLSTDITTCSKQ